VFWATGTTVSPLAIVLLVGAPMASDLLELSLSRRREFLADAGAVELTGDPVALARALERIARLQGDDWERFTARGGRWLRWFRTHPTTDERIERLTELMASPASLAQWSWAENQRDLPHPRSQSPGQRVMRRLLL
jgi:heat shock protein HtpX